MSKIECTKFAPATIAPKINTNNTGNPKPNPNPHPNPNLNPYPTPNQKHNHYPHSNSLLLGDIIAGAIIAIANVRSP